MLSVSKAWKGNLLLSIILFSCCFAFVVPCKGQQPTTYRKGALQYHISSDPKSYRAVERIDFLDTVNNKVLKSLNVIELNPYYALTKRCKVVTDTTIAYKKFIYPENYVEVKEIKRGNSVSDKPAYFVLDKAHGGSRFPLNYKAFAYVKKIFNNADSLLSVLTSYYIFNIKGEMVQEFKDMISDTHPKFTMVSNNGQYMCVSSIRTDGSDIQSLDFYDIKSKKHLDHIECPFVSHEVLPNPVLENKFMIALTFDGDSVWYQLFDVKNKTMQEERYHPDVYVKPERDGLKIVNPDRSTLYKRYIDFQFIKTDKR